LAARYKVRQGEGKRVVGCLDLTVEKVLLPFCQPYIINVCNCAAYFDLDKEVFCLAFGLTWLLLRMISGCWIT